MPDEKKTVTYLCPRMPSYATACTGENGKRLPILFVNGAYTTDNPSVQAFIEGLHNFKVGIISVKSDEAIAADAAAHQAHIASLKPHADKVKAAADRASAAAQAKAEAERRAEHDRIVSGIVAKENAERLAKEAEEAAKIEAAKKAKQDAEDAALLKDHEEKVAADAKAAAETRAKAEADAATANANKPAGDGAAQQ